MNREPQQKDVLPLHRVGKSGRVLRLSRYGTEIKYALAKKRLDRRRITLRPGQYRKLLGPKGTRCRNCTFTLACTSAEPAYTRGDVNQILPEVVHGLVAAPLVYRLP